MGNGGSLPLDAGATVSALAERLKCSFDRFFDAPTAAWEEFAGLCAEVRFAQDEVIKRERTAERYFSFILSGSAGIFLWKGNQDVCLDFAFENMFCCDYMSLLTGEATPLALVALEESVLVRITREDVLRLQRTPMGSVLFRISAESSFVEKQQQQIELLTVPAAERYRTLLKKFPGIQDRIAQKHIASYLGITPQSLSRIRRTLR